jgi:hypothetical protein
VQNAVELVTPLTLEECRRLLRCQLDRPFPFSRGKHCFKCLADRAKTSFLFEGPTACRGAGLILRVVVEKMASHRPEGVLTGPSSPG